MSNNDKLALIRQAMPVTQEKVYLNTGTSGPLSSVTIETLNKENARELVSGRADSEGFARLGEAKLALRQAFAALSGASPAEIALTHHTTEGMNIALHGLDFQAGDEVISTTLDHQGGLLPLYVLRQRKGIVVKMVDLMGIKSDAEIVARLEAAVTPRTRLILFSHVAWNTGQRLPMAQIAAMTHQHHALTLVDAAQSTGAIPLNLPASGVDFYAMPGQKWLCGPEGTGALYIRRERLSMVQQTFIGYASLENSSLYDYDGAFFAAPGARRFEVGTVYRPAVHAMAANLRWLSESVGWEFIFERIAGLSQYTFQALNALPGVKVITPEGGQSGLITFNLEGYDPARVMVKLGQENIVVRFLPHPYALRVSTGFYNTQNDVDRFIGALEETLSGSPDALPDFE
ncbi:MAG TPA: aminotransferase class V-fold PLP-dependent enzyme [Anaerolineae bacterium]|nr:aminotransferase class V-fold PLP-dependent enzyme [Anaerolineae bacterium]